MYQNGHMTSFNTKLEINTCVIFMEGELNQIGTNANSHHHIDEVIDYHI